ncbi:hypothetical protein FRB90_010493 [Tulasnella sp. 427]|nr:hypothetical protein FRB90_010493 [Tulasnella sp. 427]
MLIEALPPELLSHVFGLLLDPLDPTLENVEMSISPAPTLSLVSRYWNQVTLGTPSIWTRIVLGSDFNSLRAVEQHLHHSGDLPLDIFIYDYIHDYKPSASVLPILAAQSHRWRILYMSAVEDWDLDFLEGLSLPTLHSLRIDTFRGYKWELRIEAPRLKHFESMKIDLIYPETCQFSLSTLRTDGAWFEWDPLWSYLRSSQTTLQRLKIEGTDDVVQIPEGFSIRLSSLIEYEVYLTTLDWNALRMADMPALTRLSLTWDNPASDPLEHEKKVLVMPTLLVLELSTQHEIDIGSAIAPLLSAAPNVTKLSITDTSLTGDSVNCKATDPLCLATEEDSCIALYCSQLEELSIKGTMVGLEALEDIVFLRSSLRTITVDSVDWTWENLCSDRAALDKLRQNVELIGVHPMWREGYY